MAHQVVPHCHAEETGVDNCTPQQEEEHGFWDTIFGLNEGTNHLESYTVVKTQILSTQAQAVLQVFIAPMVLTMPLPLEQGISHSSQIPTPIRLQAHIASFSLRPPPQA